MRKLKLIVSHWPKEQRDYYDNVLSRLVEHNFITDDSILEQDISTLCTTTGISQQIMYAFIQQVINETLPTQTIENVSTFEKIYLSTGFKQLDQMLSGGFEMGKVHEICSASTISRFTPHVMADMITKYYRQQESTRDSTIKKKKEEENIHIFDTNGVYDTKYLQYLLTKQHVELDALSVVNYIQVFTLSELSKELENLCASLITASNNNNMNNRAPLVVIQDVSKVLGSHWSQTEVIDLVSHIKNLCKFGCFMLIEHKVSLADMTEKPPMKKYEMHWNPSIDTRLYFTGLNGVTRVDVLKARHVIAPQSISINIE